MRRTALMVRALTVERILSLLDKPIDAAMILALIIWGPLESFAIGFIATLAFSLVVLELELRTGFTGVEHLKLWVDEEHSRTQSKGPFARTLDRLAALRGRLRSALRRSLRSYWGMILIGSIVVIDTDYVVLLLKRPGESRLSIVCRVMIPSAAWNIGVWTFLFWIALKISIWFWVWMTGCEPAACLVEPGWQPVLETLRAIESAIYNIVSRVA